MIIPFHEANDLLVQAIQSVQKSTEVVTRLILVNDTKKPEVDCNEFIKMATLNSNYVVVKSESHGYAGSLNTGLKYTNAEFVGLMNSDDLVSDTRFSRQIASLLQGGSDLCIAQIEKFYGDYKIPSLAGKVDVGLYDTKFLLLGAYGADATIVGRNSAIKKIVFDEKIKSSDWVMALKYFPTMKIAGDPRAIYLYRLHGGQVSRDVVHTSNNFHEIYPHWVNFNRNLGLPDLDLDTARVVAAPSELSNIDYVNVDLMKEWVKAYLNLFTNQEQRRVAEGLIKRRRCIFVVRGGRSWFDPVVLLTMCYEALISKFRGVSPR